MKEMTPDILVIGHVAKDVTSDGYTLGGAVTFAAIAAERLGLRPAVVTSAASDVDIASVLRDTPVHVIESAETTTFVNTYRSGRRTQLIRGVGGPIHAEDVPEAWRSAPIVILGCLTGELSADMIDCFHDSLTLASMQGWLRRWDESGAVFPGAWSGEEILPHVNASILSIDDIQDTSLLDDWKSLAQTLIFTRGAEGADVHFDGRWHHVDAFPVDEVDPTGAGDVFATSYMVRLFETSDPIESAQFASCAASFCVQANGIEGIATRDRIEHRLKHCSS